MLVQDCSRVSLGEHEKPDEVHDEMIADLELCRDILFKYAEEECYPSKIQLDDLLDIYFERSQDQIVFNVLALKEAGLLDARIELSVGADLHSVVIDKGIIGLTPHLGSEFVHHARSEKLWKMALNKFGDAGMGAALSRMFDVLTNLPLS